MEIKTSKMSRRCPTGSIGEGISKNRCLHFFIGASEVGPRLCQNSKIFVLEKIWKNGIFELGSPSSKNGNSEKNRGKFRYALYFFIHGMGKIYGRDGDFF